MTDDLVKRLRGVMCGDDPVIEEAADYIERLEKLLVRTFENMMEDGRRVETLEAGEEKWNRICNSYAARIDKLEAALREIIGALNDPKGGQHVYDMRNGSYIARKALEGKND